VFQDPSSALDPRMTVEEILREPLIVHGLDGAAGQDAIARLLERVHLPSTKRASLPHELSGGERQRVSIARALAVEPELLVLDEPLSALDLVTQEHVLDLLSELSERLQLAYVLISHDLAVVRRLATRVAVMQAGRIVELGDTDRIFTAPENVHTRAMLRASSGMAGGAEPR
jgi:ABC-type glutathione transport system ATPase component